MNRYLGKSKRQIEMSVPNPVLIKSLRGNLVETIHRGSYIVVNARGETKISAGDV